MTDSAEFGWHVVSGEDLLAMLRRIAEGEDPDMVYAEEYANATRERIESRPVTEMREAIALWADETYDSDMAARMRDYLERNPVAEGGTDE